MNQSQLLLIFLRSSWNRRAWEANTVIDETIFSVYPHLRKKQSELEFGYKISHENLSKEQQKIHVLPLGSRLHP